MKKIEEDNLKTINGGISDLMLSVIGAAITLFAGIVTGFVNPNKCNL